MIVVFSGGVGGARMCAGLTQVFAPDRLLVVVNNGDDFDHWGLRICPDLDTVMYTLSGRVDESQGWGLRDETWQVLAAMGEAGGEDWFRLGDRDLATHLLRTDMLAQGRTLSEATALLASRSGIRHRIVPSTDDHHRTIVDTDSGPLAFQDYFVRQRCAPSIRGVRFDSGSAGRAAMPSPEFQRAIDGGDVEAVVVCPSNPVLSVEPLLALPGVREWLDRRDFPVIAVSPLIGGKAVKGPAAKIFGELGLEASIGGLDRWYGGRVDGWLLDSSDAASASAVGSGVRVRTCDTLLSTHDRRRSVAEAIADWLEAWR